MSDAAWPRLFASLGAVALGAVAVVVVAVLGHRTPGPVESSASAASQPSGSSSSGSSESSFPAPPRNAVVFSRPNGSDVLALAVTPGSPLGLQASVVDIQGEGVGGLRVNFRVGDKAAVGEPCGAGCYGAKVPNAAAPKEVVVSVARKNGTTTWHVPMPKQWPPRNASALVAQATSNYRALDTLAIHDRLSSDENRGAVVTRWRIVAPDKLDYEIEGGTKGVIIGNKRWDKTPGSDWVKAGQAPIHQPTPFWERWRNAHVLATAKGGWRVSFFDPTTPGWYELFIQRKTMRPLEMYMRAKAHFMHDTYSDFNRPITITPPQ